MIKKPPHKVAYRGRAHARRTHFSQQCIVMSSGSAEEYNTLPSSPQPTSTAAASVAAAPGLSLAGSAAAAAPAGQTAPAPEADGGEVPIKTVAAAQAAFSSGDAEASKALHEAPAAATEKHGGWGSDNIKSIIFGGLDGVITTFSTIASAFGGNQSTQVVITLGFANLIADGLSMGVGDFLSSRAEFQHLVAEKAREEWEFDNFPEGERAEMVTKLIEDKAFAAEDAEKVIGVLGAKEHRDFFVDYMMHEELGLEIPDDPWAPLKDGAMTFVSFLIFGAVPLIVYAACWGGGLADQGAIFGIACAFTFVTLVALGVLQGAITGLPLWRAGLYMGAIGSLAAAAAFLVGWGLGKAITAEPC